LLLNNNLFGGGNSAYQKMTLTSNFDRYIGNIMPKQIVETYLTRKYERNYSYLGNGLVIIDCFNDVPDLPYMNKYGRYLCYNEYYNDNITSQYKINEFVYLMEISSHDPNFTNTSFTIKENYNEMTYYNKYNVVVEYRYDSLQRGQNTTGIQLAMLVFDNETKRLSDFQFTSIQYPIIYAFVDEIERVAIRKHNYQYEYDNLGRIKNIYIKYNEERILYKTYYYDGKLRTFEKPYFTGIELPGLEEIIIYDNQTLKYHLKLFSGSYHNRPPETIEMRDSRYYYVIFEYDENKNEIQQTKYFGINNQIYPQYEYIVIQSDILNKDKYGNWTKTVIHNENTNEILECTREIIY